MRFIITLPSTTSNLSKSTARLFRKWTMCRYRRSSEIYFRPEEVQHALEAAKFEMMLSKYERLKADREQQLADIAEQENEHRQKLNKFKSELDSSQRAYKLRSKSLLIHYVLIHFEFLPSFLTLLKGCS